MNIMSKNWKETTISYILRDREYRIHDKWPLVSFKDIQDHYVPLDKSMITFDLIINDVSEGRDKDYNIYYDRYINGVYTRYSESQDNDIGLSSKYFDKITKYINKKDVYLEKYLQFISAEGNLSQMLNDNIYDFMSINRFENSGFVIAGGCICDVIFLDRQENDIDIFFYGLEEECTILYNELLEYFYSKKHYKNPTKSSYTYNFFVIDDIDNKKHNIQIISKLHKTKDQIIGYFDLFVSAVLYDGKDILMTEIAAYSYMTNMIYIDPTKRSNTYIQRIHKYMRKGFFASVPEIGDIQIVYGMIVYKNFVFVKNIELLLSNEYIKKDILTGYDIRLNDLNPNLFFQFYKKKFFDKIQFPLDSFRNVFLPSDLYQQIYNFLIKKDFNERRSFIKYQYHIKARDYVINKLLQENQDINKLSDDDLKNEMITIATNIYIYKLLQDLLIHIDNMNNNTQIWYKTSNLFECKPVNSKFYFKEYKDVGLSDYTFSINLLTKIYLQKYSFLRIPENMMFNIAKSIYTRSNMIYDLNNLDRRNTSYSNIYKYNDTKRITIKLNGNNIELDNNFIYKCTLLNSIYDIQSFRGVNLNSTNISEENIKLLSYFSSLEDKHLDYLPHLLENFLRYNKPSVDIIIHADFLGYKVFIDLICDFIKDCIEDEDENKILDRMNVYFNISNDQNEIEIFDNYKIKFEKLKSKTKDFDIKFH